jgi:hypothetical protein
MDIDENIAKVAVAALAGYGLGTIAVKITKKMHKTISRKNQFVDPFRGETIEASAEKMMLRLWDAVEDEHVDKEYLFGLFCSELDWLAVVVETTKN